MQIVVDVTNQYANNRKAAWKDKLFRGMFTIENVFGRRFGIEVVSGVRKSIQSCMQTSLKISTEAKRSCWQEY